MERRHQERMRRATRAAIERDRNDGPKPEDPKTTMTANELNKIYQAQLEVLAPSAGAIRHMLAEMRRRPPGTWKPDRPAWVWSDLHLHHRNIIRYTNRPFAGCEQMDGALHGAWRQIVGDDDVVICGGDVARAGSLNALRLDRVATAPGRKLLVLGNHDFTRRGKVAQTGFDEAWMTLLVATDPPLAFTHLPLEDLPAGVVNVHGHVHNNEPLCSGRYINICVEHTDYRALPLQAVVRLAAELIDGCTPAGRDDDRAPPGDGHDELNRPDRCAVLAETLSAFLTRLRASAETLDILERQRIVRLLVKEVLVSDDSIVIRHCIPVAAGLSLQRSR